MTLLLGLLGYASRQMSMDLDVSIVSGLVVNWVIGHPALTIQVGLDFQKKGKVLYEGHDCPPFVTCYDPMISITSNHPSRSAYISDHIWMGRQAFLSDVEFQVCDAPTRGPAMRDVAGYVGAAPASLLFHNKIMELRLVERGDWVSFRQTTTPEESHQWIDSDSASEWRIKALLFGKSAASIILNFRLANRLLIPFEFCSEILGRVCDTSVMDKWLIDHDWRIPISVDSYSFILTPDQVKFTSDPHIAMGISFLAVVDSIFFDFANSRLTFRPRKKAAAISPRLIESLVPHFRLPHPVQGPKIEMYGDSVFGTFMLVNQHSFDRASTESGSLESCWRLYKLHEENSGLRDNVVIAGTFSRIRFEMTPELLSWTPVETSNPARHRYSELRLDFSPRKYVEVCAAHREDLSQFDLPESEVIEAAQHPLIGDECVVCLGNFEEGDIVRGMNECDHVMHELCLAKWLNRKPSCPTCRAPVERRGNGGWDFFEGCTIS